MYTNPTIKHKEMREKVLRKFRIVLVVKDTLNAEHQKVYEFCKNEKIPFLYREFNSREFEEDQDHIVSLPALHVYYKNNHTKTVHMNEDIISCILSEINKHQVQSVKKKSYWFSFKNIFK